MRKTKIANLIYTVSIIFIFGLIQINAQKTELSLKDKKITIQRENVSLGIIFKDLLELYDVPIGFEQSELDSKNFDYVFEVNIHYDENCVTSSENGSNSKCKKLIPYSKSGNFTINVENESLENVLNQIVSKMKYYKWEINDDVVNIFPIEGREKKLEEILNVKLEKFSVRAYSNPLNIIKIQDIQPSIIFTPEILEFYKTNRLNYTTPTQFSSNLRKPVTDDLSFSDITLKELLNKITQKKRGGWRIRVSRTGSFTFVNIDI